MKATSARLRHRPEQSRRYALAPPNRWALVLWLWLPILATAAVLGWLAWAPAHGAPPHAAADVAAPVAWLLTAQTRLGSAHALGAIATLLIGGALTTALHARRGIALHGDTLVVRAALFTRRVPRAAMRLESARVLDLAERTEFKPGMKKFGFGYPGFHAGYYRSRDAGPAFYLLTDTRRVLALPLHDNSWLILSPAQPQRLLEDLRRLA